MTGLSVANAEWFLNPRRKPSSRASTARLRGAVAGGAVRNTLLDEPVREVDFATTARPEDTLRLAAQAGIKTVPTGLSHGTVTLIVHGVPFEVTTLRQDIETHGRHATVAFGEDWVEDARRRDFTMNALYAGSKGDVHDPLEGAADLVARRVRFVGDAGTRIRKTICASCAFSVSALGMPKARLIAKASPPQFRAVGLQRLSRERIRSELIHILVARRAVDALEVMDESGLLILILGGVARRERFNRLCRIEAALGLRPDRYSGSRRWRFISGGRGAPFGKAAPLLARDE